MSVSRRSLVMGGATEFTGKHTDFIKQARQMQKTPYS
jgi:hypothetical protein